MKYLSFLCIVLYVFSGCQSEQKTVIDQSEEQLEKNIENFESALQKHLDAVSNKDLKTLESTLHPNGKMLLLLQTER